MQQQNKTRNQTVVTGLQDLYIEGHKINEFSFSIYCKVNDAGVRLSHAYLNGIFGLILFISSTYLKGIFMYASIYTAYARAYDQPASEVSSRMATTIRSLRSGHFTAEALQIDKASDMNHALVAGDIYIAMGCMQDAEDAYRHAVKCAAKGSRGLTRIVSFRTTGMLSLVAGRYCVALDCFRRTVADPLANSVYQVEARCLQAVALHAMGKVTVAQAVLLQAQIAADNCKLTTSRMMVDYLWAEMLTHSALFTHPELHDHVFWRSINGDPKPPCDSADGIIAKLGNDSTPCPFAKNRLNQLAAQLLASCNDQRCLSLLGQNATPGTEHQLIYCEMQWRIDKAISYLAMRHYDEAHLLIHPLVVDSFRSGKNRWHIDLLYCEAKIAISTNIFSDPVASFRRYADEVVRFLRTEVEQSAEDRQAVATLNGKAVRDGIEMGLPAKYRRAYRYMLENISNPKLSIREMSDHIKVTERSLQLAFKTNLGMTPSEVIRKCRLEGIHADLQREPSSNGGIIGVGERWGISNRSAFSRAYRIAFNESPRQTLAHED